MSGRVDSLDLPAPEGLVPSLEQRVRDLESKNAALEQAQADMQAALAPLLDANLPARVDALEGRDGGESTTVVQQVADPSHADRLAALESDLATLR